MKSAEEIRQILEAFDLTNSYRDAAELAGCDHHTVASHVAARDEGRLSAAPARRDQIIDPFLTKVEEWMEQSNGKVRADVAHDKLVAMGFTGSERTTRRAVAIARRAFVAGHRRVHRPCVPEPGLWLNTTSAPVRAWPERPACCSVPGWPGAGSGWCSPSATRPCPRSSAPST